MTCRSISLANKIPNAKRLAPGGVKRNMCFILTLHVSEFIYMIVNSFVPNTPYRTRPRTPPFPSDEHPPQSTMGKLSTSLLMTWPLHQQLPGQSKPELSTLPLHQHPSIDVSHEPHQNTKQNQRTNLTAKNPSNQPAFARQPPLRDSNSTTDTTKSARTALPGVRQKSRQRRYQAGGVPPRCHCCCTQDGYSQHSQTSFFASLCRKSKASNCSTTSLFLALSFSMPGRG